MTVTALSIALSSRLFSTADETPKSFQSINNTTTQYRSASNSLLARTEDRTPKRNSKDVCTPSDRSRSTFTDSVNQTHSLYSLLRQAVTSHGIIYIIFKCISCPNRDIEKIPAPLRSHISSPSLSPRSGAQAWLLPVLTPVKLSSQL
ncbi:hypothetical protein AVEN_123307-1 [Araneus ventricosus]|uniref:Uncharacterized protein n=1 Tax=Araneus ventricosus TaxID=182803 RepID=A0A4Y2W6C1_ARAVE|nr:hypothetical protein AVEN_123307-1 [Araneus ventricosus]